MIKLIPNLSISNSKSKTVNQRMNGTYLSIENKSNQLADTFTNSNSMSNVSFKGNNPLSLVKGKIKLINIFSKSGKNLEKELPSVKKPIVAAIDPEDLLPGMLSKDKLSAQAAVVDNMAFGATKFALASKAAAAGTALAGPVGAFVGFVGVYILWGSLRNSIVKNNK